MLQKEESALKSSTPASLAATIAGGDKSGLTSDVYKSKILTLKTLTAISSHLSIITKCLWSYAIDKSMLCLLHGRFINNEQSAREYHIPLPSTRILIFDVHDAITTDIVCRYFGALVMDVHRLDLGIKIHIIECGLQ